MCKTIHNDNVSLNNYNIEIDIQCYNNDYDDICFEEQNETNTESDILFE